MDTRFEVTDPDAPVVLDVERPGRVGDDEVEPLVFAVVEFALDETDGLLGGGFPEGFADEQPARAGAGHVAVGPAVRDSDHDVVFVVADPGAAGLGVTRRDHAWLFVDDVGGVRGTTEQFVAVGRRDHRRVREHLPGEDERTHATTYVTNVIKIRGTSVAWSVSDSGSSSIRPSQSRPTEAARRSLTASRSTVPEAVLGTASATATVFGTA